MTRVPLFADCLLASQITYLNSVVMPDEQSEEGSEEASSEDGDADDDL